jgi:hypothetical protein
MQPFHPIYQAYPGPPWAWDHPAGGPGYAAGAPVAAQPVEQSSSPVVTVAIVLVVGALGAYLIYEASKHAKPIQKKVAAAAVKAVEREAKRTGKIMRERAGNAASNLARNIVEQRLAARRPRKMHVEVLRSTPL